MNSSTDPVPSRKRDNMYKITYATMDPVLDLGEEKTHSTRGKETKTHAQNIHLCLLGECCHALQVLSSFAVVSTIANCAKRRKETTH